MSRQILPPPLDKISPSIHSIIAGTASLNTYLVEVDDGEAIGLSRPHVLNVEVEPLSVLVGIEVKAQVQLIIPLAPGEIISLWVVYLSLSLSLSLTLVRLCQDFHSQISTQISVLYHQGLVEAWPWTRTSWAQLWNKCTTPTINNYVNTFATLAFTVQVYKV